MWFNADASPGSIECRFADVNIRRLGEYFNETGSGNNLYFSVQERDSQNEAMKLFLTGALITKMIEERRFNLGPIDVTVAQRIAIVEIALHFSKGNSFPISGFPRHLQHDETKCEIYSVALAPTVCGLANFSI
jgi:hypothetical protein